MKRSTQRLGAVVLAAAVLAACAGGSGANRGGSIVPATSDATTGAAAFATARHHKPIKAVIHFVIPRLHPHKAHFVSAATMGVQFVATNAASNASITTIANLSPASGNCTTGPTTRTCNVSTLVPVGNDKIDVTTYDTAPSGGKFPPSANVLGLGSVTQQIIVGSTPQIAIYIGGVIASIGAGPAFSSVPADGNSHTAAFVVAPTDFGNQPISAGNNDPFANPITATLTETGGSGHAVLLLDGKPSGSSATLTVSSDTVALKYDGGGHVGYVANVNFTASGASTQKTQVAPMFVTSTSSLYASGKLSLQGLPATAEVDVDEAGSPPSGQSYTATRSGCAGIATVATASNTPASAAFNVTGGATASPVGTCTIAIGDGTSSISLDVSNTTTGGSVGLPGTVINAYPVPVAMPTSPAQITVGPDQQLWYSTTSTNVQSVSTSGSFVNYSLPGALPSGITTGPDGAIWMTDSSFDQIVRFQPPSSTTLYTIGNGALPSATQPVGITTGPDGYLWFTDASNNAIDRMSVTGNVQQIIIPSDSTPASIAAGPDNAVWYTETGGSAIGRVDDGSFAVTETTTPNAPASIALGPDGAMWFTEPAVDTIGRISTDGNFTLNFYPAPTGSTPTTIARGPDNAMYFTEIGTNKIGRINVSTHAVTSYAVTGPGLTGIVTGPDNNIWYTQGSSTTNQIVEMNP